MPEAEFIEIYRAKNAVEAHLVAAALEQAGIAVQITDESTAGMYPDFWWSAPRIVVAAADAEQAAAVIRTFDGPPGEPDEDEV